MDNTMLTRSKHDHKLVNTNSTCLLVRYENILYAILLDARVKCKILDSRNTEAKAYTRLTDCVGGKIRPRVFLPRFERFHSMGKRQREDRRRLTHCRDDSRCLLLCSFSSFHEKYFLNARYVISVPLHSEASSHRHQLCSY